MSTETHIPIATLSEGLGQVRLLLRRIESDTAKLKLLVDGLEGNDPELLAGTIARVSPGGHIRNLSKKIITVLEQSEEPLTSVQIAERLYRVGFGLEESAFRRRVIGTVSAMAKQAKGVVPAFEVGRGKEKHWTVDRKQEGPPLRMAP